MSRFLMLNIVDTPLHRSPARVVQGGYDVGTVSIRSNSNAGTLFHELALVQLACYISGWELLCRFSESEFVKN